MDEAEESLQAAPAGLFNARLNCLLTVQALDSSKTQLPGCCEITTRLAPGRFLYLSGRMHMEWNLNMESVLYKSK